MNNVKPSVLSVSGLTQRIKSLLESHISSFWIQGEVSNVRKQSSGHLYFTLKDAYSQIACVMFRNESRMLPLDLKDGVKVIALAELSVYEPRGNYQLIIRIINATGTGKLQEAFEQLKEKFLLEGLFDKAKKQPIPPLPQTIGMITSESGAAVRDVISVLRRRKWSGKLVILPAQVQGEGASKQILAQLQLAIRLNCFDLLVIGRGGGSIEDLWAFNDETLVRSIANCPIPTISAIGHETDFTLSDFAADLRAETPTAAAELISSAYLQKQQHFCHLSERLENKIKHAFALFNYKVHSLKNQLKGASPQKLIEKNYLKLDEYFYKVTHLTYGTLHTKRLKLIRLKERLYKASPLQNLAILSERLSQLTKRLHIGSVQTTLKRGFALVKRNNGAFLTQANTATSNENLTIIFADSQLNVSVKQTNNTLPLA